MSALAEFLTGRALRDNPQFAQNYYQQQELEANRAYLDDLMGAPGQAMQPGQQVENLPTEFGAMDFNVAGQEVPRMEGFQPELQGTGLLGGQLSPIETAMKFMQAPGAQTRTLGGNMMAQLMQPQQQRGFDFNAYMQLDPQQRELYDRFKGRAQAPGMPGIVGSPIKLGSGNYGFLSETGQVVDTGTPYYDPMKDIMVSGTPYSYSPRTGQLQPTVIGGQTLTPEIVGQQQAEQERLKQQAGEEVKQQAEARTAATMAEDAMVYTKQARDIVKEMNEAQLGPIAAMTPDLTGESQLLKQSLNNLIGNVREKLGPGLLSDTDIQLLKSMIPSMAMDKDVLLKSLDLFDEEMTRIIERNMKNQQSTQPSTPAQGNFEGWKVIR